MPASLRAVISRSTDPYVNLTIEDRLLETVTPGCRILFLYRNRDSVVIGRHQNPWIECDLPAMNRDDVLLVRRQSGGGAVFHDTGNTNYSFLSTKAEYDQDAGFGIILSALRGLGLDVERNERNDLVYQGRKFSGSAFRHRRERSFQHGTLLLSADLDRLTQYLTAPGRSITAKGTASVRSTVVNLSSVEPAVTHQGVCDAIIAQFGRWYGDPVLVGEYIETQEAVASHSEESHSVSIDTWDWLYGKTPDFEHRVLVPVDERLVECTLRVHRGKVAATITESVAGLAVAVEALVGCRYLASELCSSLYGAAPRQTAALLCKILGKEIP